MKQTLTTIGLLFILLIPFSQAALYQDVCWSLTNGISCFNGSTGTNTITGAKIDYSDVLNAPAGGSYDLNISGDTGSGTITDAEIFSIT